MPHSFRRFTVARVALVSAVAAFGLTGCIMPPSGDPGTPPPTPTADPGETGTASTPTPAATPSATPSEPSAGGSLPELVAINTPLPEGTLAGWETSIITDSAFAVQSDSDFPVGPTISVVETATGCTFWAYQGAQDSESSDEGESSEATLSLLSSSSPADWSPGADVFELAPSASQGTAVEFLSIVQEPESGSARAWFARNFQSSGSTSSIAAECPEGAGGIDHIDEVVLEYFQINFLQP